MRVMARDRSSALKTVRFDKTPTSFSASLDGH